MRELEHWTSGGALDGDSSSWRSLGRRRRSRYRYRLIPSWLTRKRAVLAAVAITALVAGSYGARLAISLGVLTHQNPFSALLDLIRGKGDSDVQQQIQDLRRINIALYGYGGPSHDGPYLTDSVMVVSIQPRQGAAPQVAEVSVPRDWYVPIQLGDGRSVRARINEAYADGVEGRSSQPRELESGPRVADATLERVLGLHIDHHVGIDFTAFQAGVDAVGGIDVDVPNSFTDRQYPRGECGANGSGDCAYRTVRFRAGRQHLDGASALILARSRHSLDNGEGSDFARSRRQQLVLQALKTRVVSLGGFGHLPDLLSALGHDMVTDLRIGDAEALYDLVKDVDHRDITRVSLDDGNFLYECGYPADCGAAYLFAHDSSYRSVALFMQHLFVDPAALGEHAPLLLTDASGSGGAASARWSGLLSGLGLAARDGGAVRTRPSTRLVDDGSGHEATDRWLSDYFGVPVERPAQPLAGGGIRLILGQDEERVFNAGAQSEAAQGSGRQSRS